jgi:uncharacterized membrane protein YphA (DoxX/SURF4 family)
VKGYLILAARLALALTFGYAALSKLGDMHQFAEDIANYRMVPPSLVGTATAAVVGVELLCAVLLLVGLLVRPTAAVVALMLLAFIAGLSQALARGIDLACGCFGHAETATWGTVARDVVLLGIALVPLRFGAGRVSLDTRHS